MSMLFVGTGTNLKTGKPIVFRIHDRFGLTDPKRSIGQLERNILIDRLTDAITGESIEGSQSNKIQDIGIAIEFESNKSAGLIKGGEALTAIGKLFANVMVNKRMAIGAKCVFPLDTRRESDALKAGFREVGGDLFHRPMLRYCKSQGLAISPELESALMADSDFSQNPALKQEYMVLYGKYVEYRDKPRK